MPTLIQVEQLRANFPFVIQTDVKDLQLGYSLVSASARLKTWVGDAVYAAALAEGETEERKIVLQNAEGHLALHFALLGLNTNLRNFGLVAEEQVEGNTTNRYFQPEKVAMFDSMYLEKAREIAEPYLLSDGTPTATFEAVDGE